MVNAINDVVWKTEKCKTIIKQFKIGKFCFESSVI